jgi:hypothetical protein
MTSCHTTETLILPHFSKSRQADLPVNRELSLIPGRLGSLSRVERVGMIVV